MIRKGADALFLVSVHPSIALEPNGKSAVSVGHFEEAKVFCFEHEKIIQFRSKVNKLRKEGENSQ